MGIDEEILADFKEESGEILNEAIEILEDIEGETEQVKRLEDVGVRVDRIMGAAQGLALECEEGHAIHQISKCAKLCKAISYKGSQIEANEQFFNVCVALLIDACELMTSTIESLDESTEKKEHKINDTFIDRLTWVDNQFAEGTRATVAD